MNENAPARPALVLAAVAIAITMGLADAVDTILSALRPEGTGAIGGTLLRDILLIVAAVFLLRRVAWAGWTLIALFAISLLRVLAADEPIEFVNALGVVGIALLVLPQSRAWWMRKSAPQA